MRRIGILHPGKMGISIAASAMNDGHQVYWMSEGRSDETRERAEKHNLIEIHSLFEFCQTCEIIFSICPPHAAEDVANSVMDVGFRADCESMDGITTMSKPAMNILRRNGQQSLFEGLEQIGQGSGLETAQDRLDLRPSQFNRVEVGRVRRQVDQVRATRADQLLESSDLVRGEIVHEQNITRLEGREDTLLNIAIKQRTINGPRQHQGGRDPRPAHHRQRGGLGSRGLRRRVHHALVRCGAPVQTGQAGIYAGFIQKFEASHIQLRDFFLKHAAFPFHTRRVPLAGMERLFFRGNLSRANSRHIRLGSDWIFVSFSTCSHNSCKVASGCAFTAARIPASTAASLRGTPPAWGSGALLPVLRFRANQRSREGSLTLYRRAAAGILHSPLSTLAITRSRRSVEYAFMPPIMPSNR